MKDLTADIFHAAASALGVAPHEVLHVGDDATLDAHGAMAAGMQAVWLNTTGHAWPHATPPHATVSSLSELCRLLQAGQAGLAGQAPASPSLPQSTDAT